MTMNLTTDQETQPPITKHEASELLRVSIRTVDRLMADGTLPYSKVGRSVRIQRSDVIAMLSSPAYSATPIPESAGDVRAPERRAS